MRIVFDLDETICRHSNRDYENAAPLEPTIQRMRELKAGIPDCEIVILTARGMKSCGGDAAKADAKNRSVTEAWLDKHGVPYDSLIFGKPFADAYVDDKSVTLEEWQSMGVGRMSGYSGKPVSRIGRIVVKSDDGAQRDWYAKASEFGLRTISFPTVISWSFGRLFLRYVDGTALDSATDEDMLSYIPLCAAAIREMGSRPVEGENDILDYGQLVGERAKLAKMDEARLSGLLDRLFALRAFKKRTFCHGDFSPMNIIRAYGGGLYLIDPSFKPFFSTYLSDAAKFRACLRGMASVLKHAPRQYAKSLQYWDSLWTAEENEAIGILERTHLVRVAGLARGKGDNEVADALLRMEREVAV